MIIALEKIRVEVQTQARKGFVRELFDSEVDF
jgi:hypothetical protein